MRSAYGESLDNALAAVERKRTASAASSAMEFERKELPGN